MGLGKPMLWMSIAATGNGEDPKASIPTEIAAILTDSEMRPVDGTYDRIIITREHAAALKADKEAMVALKRENAVHPKHPDAVTILNAEASILEMLDDAKVDVLVPIAGRGADRFLLPVVTEHMPNLRKRLEGWTFDSSQLARWARAASGLGAFRKHVPDLRDYDPLFEAMPPYSQATFKEIFTAAHQFRAILKEHE